MPYTYEQCQAFGAKAARGERVPSDWKEKCAGVKKTAGGGRKKRPTKKR